MRTFSTLRSPRGFREIFHLFVLPRDARSSDTPGAYFSENALSERAISSRRVIVVHQTMTA